LPSLNISLSSGQPLIQVFVAVSLPRQQAMIAAGIEIPPPKAGTFLIDTGASCTCVDQSLMEGLGIAPTGVINIQTPSTEGGSHACNTYDVMFFIPDNQNTGYVIEALPVVETHLKTQGIDGLIGRDILDKCLLVYNGTASFLTLSY